MPHSVQNGLDLYSIHVHWRGPSWNYFNTFHSCLYEKKNDSLINLQTLEIHSPPPLCLGLPFLPALGSCHTEFSVLHTRHLPPPRPHDLCTTTSQKSDTPPPSCRWLISSLSLLCPHWARRAPAVLPGLCCSWHSTYPFTILSGTALPPMDWKVYEGPVMTHFQPSLESKN